MLFWSEQDLDALPADEAFLCESWDGRRGEVVRSRLEGMLTAYGGVDPGYGGVRDVDEEGCSTECQL